MTNPLDKNPPPAAEKPTPPADFECCGGGSCSPCVWDRYYDELHEWNEQQNNTQTPAPKATPPEPIDPDTHYR